MTATPSQFPRPPLARSPMAALDAACRVFGSQQALADALPLKSPAISAWRRTGQIPAEWAEPIEARCLARWNQLDDRLRALIGAPPWCEELAPHFGWERDHDGFVTARVEAVEAIAPELLQQVQP